MPNRPSNLRFLSPIKRINASDTPLSDDVRSPIDSPMDGRLLIPKNPLTRRLSHSFPDQMMPDIDGLEEWCVIDCIG